MSDRNFAADYIQVNERIAAFRDRYPDGSLQSELLRLDESIVVMKAYAYRTPDDPRPGIGHSSLGIPGKTPYTRDSELENCETSAFGRALAALGFEVKRGVASAEEIRNKQRPAPVGTDMRERLLEVAKAKGIDHAGLERFATQVGIAKGERATPEQLVALINVIQGIEQPSSGVPTAPADGGAVPEGAAPPTTPPSDADGSDAATDQPERPPSPAGPAPTFEDVLRVSGGVEVPPAPGSAAYRALSSGVERAAAKAYWEAQPEQLRVPA